MIKNLIKKTAAVLFWLLLWTVAAYAVSKPLLLPSPFAVARRVFELCGETFFWQSIGLSLLRIVTGIAFSLVAGALVGALCAAFDTASLLLKPLMSVIKSTPVASFIMLALLWIDRDILPAFISVLIVLPVVVSNVFTGIKSTDKNLYEVTRVFGFGLYKKLKYLYIPSVRPYFLSACRSSLGLAWKAGIAAEVLAVPVLSIGKMIYESKLYLETTDLFAWTSVVVILSVIIDAVFERLVKKNADI